jgi:FMN phosphatase YigB (HAD superfamily)
MSTAIVFDIDGVLCDLTGTLLMAFAERWPDTPLERPTAYATIDAYPHLTEEQQAWWTAAYNNPYYYATALPAPYAKAVVHGARLFHHAVYFRSSRPAHLEATTRTWLEAWGFLPHDASPTAFACGTHAKPDARYLPAEHLIIIDDDRATIERLMAMPERTGKQFTYLLIDQPYNQGALTDGVTRIATLRDLPLIFGDLWQAEQPGRTPIAA